MQIAIIGYGKMGQAVERAAIEEGHIVVAKIDTENDWLKYAADLERAEVAIEFSTPATAKDNILRCFEMNLPVVIGTTGWDNNLDEIRKKCEDEKQAMFVASNFSLGVNLFFVLNRYFSQVMNQFPQYEVSVEETHHTQKLDKPSGTAKSLLKDLIVNLENKNSWVESNNPKPDEIAVVAHRMENVPGIHEVIYSSDDDVIILKHTAKSRKGFAKGALAAAVWLVNKKGFYGMEDLLAEVTL